MNCSSRILSSVCVCVCAKQLKAKLILALILFAQKLNLFFIQPSLRKRIKHRWQVYKSKKNNQFKIKSAKLRYLKIMVIPLLIARRKK